MATKRTCRKYGCHESPHRGGLCEAHHDEERLKETRRAAAVTALHNLTIDGKLPENPALKEELRLMRGWWDRAVNSLNYRPDPLLGGEAEFALEWCISLAQEIVDAEKAFRKGESPSYMLEATRSWVWDRFRNLEAGLHSNGTSRK